MLLAAASILFSVCILLIPFLAKRIVEGDLGSTMLMAVLGTAAAMAQAAVATASGATEGFGRTATSGGGAESAEWVVRCPTARHQHRRPRRRTSRGCQHIASNWRSIGSTGINGIDRPAPSGEHPPCHWVAGRRCGSAWRTRCAASSPCRSRARGQERWLPLGIQIQPKGGNR